MDKLKLTLNKDEVTIKEGSNDFISQLMGGCRGTIRIKNPLFRREIHKVKDAKGKVLKDDNHPENVGKIEKKKKE